MLNNIYYLNGDINNLIVKNGLSLFEFNSKYLLNIKKDFFNTIEKISYELALFHIEKMNLNLDEVYIEFFVEKFIENNIELHFNDNTNNNLSSIISTITYLNDNNIADIFANIDIDTYKFKNFDEINFVGFVFPKFLKHISFKGSEYFHGINNLLNDNCERITLRVNILNKKNNNIFYEPKIDDKSIIFKKNDKLVYFEEKNNNYIIPESEILFNEEFIENILYKNNINLNDNILEKLLKLSHDYEYFLLEKKTELIKNKDINNNQNLIDTSLKKFIQRFTLKKFYDNFICNFIMNETISSFNNNCHLNNYNNYKIIDIEKIPSIINLVINSFQIIIDNIKKKYCFKKNELYNISKVFILKNDSSTLNDFFNENTSITINILLNSKYEDGNLLFYDDLESVFEVGDMVIFSSNTKYKYLPITQGSQYILVGLINIYE